MGWLNGKCETILSGCVVNAKYLQCHELIIRLFIRLQGLGDLFATLPDLRPPPLQGKWWGIKVQITCKKLGIPVLSDLTLFRPLMFPVGGTRRWKKKNAIFLRETRTFTGNFIVSRGYWYPDSIGNRIIIYSAVKWHLDWMDNPPIFCYLTQNVARPVFPICARLRHECNQSILVLATVNLEASVEPYDLRLCLVVFHSCDYLLSKISVWKLPRNVLLKLCHSSLV